MQVSFDVFIYCYLLAGLTFGTAWAVVGAIGNSHKLQPLVITQEDPAAIHSLSQPANSIVSLQQRW